MERYDRFMKRFLGDVSSVLQERDEYIRNKFLNSPDAAEFYKDRVKGIFTWSVTEPILKFLIFTELCDKYKMRPEDNTYKDSKLLDLSLFVDEQNEENAAEIGVEMKWAGLTKKNLLTSASLQCLVDDFTKIKNSTTSNNYLLQFLVHNPTLEIIPEQLEEQVVMQYDKRSFRYFAPKVVGVEQFPIWLADETNSNVFSLLLWKVKKQ